MISSQIYVTKTIKEHEITARVVDLTSDTVTHVTYHLYGRIPADDHKLIKELQRKTQTQIANIDNRTVKEWVCSMPIETFFNESTKIEKSN